MQATLYDYSNFFIFVLMSQIFLITCFALVGCTYTVISQYVEVCTYLEEHTCHMFGADTITTHEYNI